MKDYTHESYFFIIKVDKYVGNTHRDVLAYSTGKYHHDVNERQVKDFIDEYGQDMVYKFEDYVGTYFDDDGRYTSSEMWQVYKGEENYTEQEKYSYEGQEYERPCFNSIMFFFDKIPPQELFNIMIERIEEYLPSEGFKVMGYEWIKKIESIKYESLEKFK